MEILSYVFSAMGLLSMIIASMIKGSRMGMILLCVFFGNILVATSYLLGGSGINGAAACYLGSVMTLINFWFDRRGKKLPRFLTVVYALLFIVVNIWVAGGISALGILVIAASLIFVMCIGQTNGKMYRFWTVINMLLWCLYDILSASYSVLLSHVPQLGSAVFGMVVHDRKKA